MTFLPELYKQVAGAIGPHCAILVFIVLPLVIPVVLFIEFDKTDPASGLARGLKIIGILAIAVILSCVASGIKNAVGQSHLEGIGIALINIAVIGTAWILARQSR